MERHRISGIPVVEASNKLVGILTNRDVRFASNPGQPVHELMTKDVITSRENVGQSEAKRLLHQHRIEKLVVVDDAYLLRRPDHREGHRKSDAAPQCPARMSRGRLRVGAATSVGEDGFARTEALIAAGADVVVVDTRAWPLIPRAGKASAASSNSAITPR